MVDIHCHILPNLDDGAESLDISKEMALIAVQDGIKSIVATPHYIEYEHEISKESILNTCQQVNEFLIQNCIDLKIIPGCEAFVSPTLVESYKKGEVMSINDMGKYILIELPVASYPEYIEDVIFDFKVIGVTPIIAHIERYSYVKGDFDIIYRLINEGALMQINSTSITGLFGDEIRYKSLELIKHNMVHFIASDAHTTRGRAPKISKALETLKKEGIEDAYIDYLISNSQKVINGEDIEVIEPIKKKLSWFHKIKRRF
ncbi:capsular polysaccharide biosynthesis protein [Thermoanaerobacter kivui]|uniref:protein-tyrosine-phosphatase n=1 Tax=Thermoanaerobacter kivui TaxID=2325 RepID=A0A097AQ07_THEKI|nr:MULTISPECIES: CpsB/CapC family capsule biosynthesis tyrosine phosphatase [Thermoanaerobacter]AIS51905.1 capsular polysaccharide biosynthesis protein [Thermoanaerobacter kivui]